MLRGKVDGRTTALVRFALADADKIVEMLKEQKNLELTRWISKEQLTAVLELSRAEIEDLADSDYVSYIEVGGRMSASSAAASDTQEHTTSKERSAQNQDSSQK